MLKTLTIDLDKEYRLRIENSEEIKISFFKDVYEQAFDQVKNIVVWSNKSLEKKDLRIFSREFREYNNIIAFTGERGTGKSSAMLTVANNLVESNAKKIFLDNERKDELNFKTTFESLHTIDPSKFEKDQNIIEVILAELFENFQELIKDTSKQFNDAEKRDVLKAFQEVYKCLKIIGNIDQSKKYEGDALETLATLADATKLEKNIQNLISKYLKFIHPKNANESSTLIIPIDDFDLNVKSAGDMAEQIRKYLMIPQVLVLMAINLEQFGDVKTQEVIRDFQMLFTRSTMSESPRDVAARYILKLIPIERRIFIPKIKVERNDVDFYLSRGENVIIDKDYGNTIEERLFNYLFKHTDLYFISKKEEYHIFLPETLRELQTLSSVFGSFSHIIDLIISKNGIELTDDEKTKNKDIKEQNWKHKKENILLFNNYFTNTWIKDNLLTPFVKMIFDSSTLSTITWNKYFISSIIEIFSKEDNFKNNWIGSDKIDLNDLEFSNIIDRNNYHSNISLGDLLYFFQTLNKIYTNNKDLKKLIFSLNCFYSIKLNELNFDRNLLSKQDNDFEKEKEILLSELKNIVNGTIVNHKMNLIRNTRDQQNRLQFSVDYNGLPYKNELLQNNIFIKYQFSTYYRQSDKIVFRDVFNHGDRFKYPTLNWFSFVCKDENNFFPLPYNNLEYWLHIIEDIDKDSYKDQGENTDLLVDLFSQIYSKIKIPSVQENFKKSKILNMIYSPNSTNKNLSLADLAIIQDIYNNIFDQQRKLLNYLEKTLTENVSRKKNNIIQGLGRNSNDNELTSYITSYYLGKYKKDEEVDLNDIKRIIEYVTSISTNE